ncbi:unnamed protein product [Blepharisma stoltei]|uniref:Receptor ligand binding region domain-containing protein n=1 Tax=Blepharisma stoltei TaxID=1481888 RepID=A0AAU9KDV6_9CILI|nr:unnamed protein product [Blepharisma stoltei]
MLAFIVLLLNLVKGELNMIVLFSSSTPSSLSTYFLSNLDSSLGNSDFFFDISFYTITQSSALESYILQDLTMMVDATYDMLLHHKIDYFSNSSKILCLQIDENFKISGNWMYSVHSSLSNQILTAQAATTYFSWTRLAVISSDDVQSIQLEDSFYISNKELIDMRMAISSSLTQADVDNMIGKQIKPNGISMFVSFSKGTTNTLVLNSLQSKKVYKKGSGVLLSGRGMLGATIPDGCLIYAEKGLESATSTEMYEVLAIQQFTNLIKQLKSTALVVSAYEIKTAFDTISLEQYRYPIYTLINIYNQARVARGSIKNGKLSFTDTGIIFPGNTTVYPINSKASVSFGMAYGINEPGSTSTNPYVISSRGGAVYGIVRANQDPTLLPNFNISFIPTNCGNQLYVHDITKACYTPYVDKLGIAYLGTQYTASSQGIITVFRELGIKIPYLTDQASGYILSNKTQYPEFMRILAPTTYNAKIMVNIMNIFGWKKVAVAYSNDSSTNYYNYLSFKSECDTLGITIINDEESRAFPAYYSQDMYANYSAKFQKIKDTRARIIIPIFNTVSMWPWYEGLYDIGFRAGDIMSISMNYAGGMNLLTDSTLTEERRLKREVIMLGIITTANQEYVGTYGLQIKNELKSYYNGADPSYKCLAFDACMLILNGLKYAVDKGDDYEDPAIMNKAMRLAYFTGCSGVVSVDSASNNRNGLAISIFNIQINNTGVYKNGMPPFIEPQIGLYNPTSSTAMEISGTIIYPGNTTKTPSDTRPKPDCPFEDSEKRTSHSGQGLLFAICFTLCVVTLAITAFIWNKWWKKSVPALKESREITFGDYMTMGFVIIEFFQYLAMGPRFQGNVIIDVLSQSLSVNMDDLIDFKNTAFWIALYVVYGLCGGWFIMGFIIIFRIDIRLENVFFFRWLGIFSEHLMPVIGNVCFLPIIAMLMNVFQCTEGTSNKLTDSFLDKDCHQYCWQGDHIAFAIFAIIAFFLYLPFAVFCRPLWQEMQVAINIKANPLYLMIKSVFQMSAVVLNKTVKPTEPHAHGYIYFGTLIAFAVFLYWKKPYNYGRINLWQIIAIMGAAWSIFWTSVYNSATESTFVPWLVLQLSGWAIFLLSGVILQKKYCPSYLFRPKPISLAVLVKFAFGKTISSAEIEKKTPNFVNKKYKMEPLSKFDDTTTPQAPSVMIGGKKVHVSMDDSESVLNDRTFIRTELDTTKNY